MLTKDDIDAVYKDLQTRTIHPRGEFDKAGRFHAENGDLISVRSPSRAWPYSEMTACRTKKYVKAVAAKYGCKNAEELRQKV